MVFETSDSTFARDVLECESPVVVDFWAPWCGPCSAVEPVLAELEHELRLTVAKLNVDENPLVAARYSVLSLPTAILFADGEAREVVIGAHKRPRYEQAWADWLS